MSTSVRALCLTTLLVLAGEIFFPGCATVDHGGSQDVLVKSRPAGAKVFVDGKLIGPAPVIARLSRWGFHRVRIEAPGFEPLEFPLVKKVWSWEGLFSLCFPPGYVIDLATGAIFELNLPERLPAGVSRGQWEQGDGKLWGSLTVTAEFHPRRHGSQIGMMKPAPSASAPPR